MVKKIYKKGSKVCYKGMKRIGRIIDVKRFRKLGERGKKTGIEYSVKFKDTNKVGYYYPSELRKC